MKFFLKSSLLRIMAGAWSLLFFDLCVVQWLIFSMFKCVKVWTLVNWFVYVGH